MAHYTMKQCGSVLNVVPTALHMNDDVDERACCVVVQECCCLFCLTKFRWGYDICTWCLAYIIAGEPLHRLINKNDDEMNNI